MTWLGPNVRDAVGSCCSSGMPLVEVPEGNVHHSGPARILDIRCWPKHSFLDAQGALAFLVEDTADDEEAASAGGDQNSLLIQKEVT